MADEFKTHLLNEAGLERVRTIGEGFQLLLQALDALGVPPGRDRAIVVTKLQEACFFAKRAIADQPESQL
jgi:hypothetical protein